MTSLWARSGSFQHFYAALPTIGSSAFEGCLMDIAYVALAALSWVLVVGMAVGCAKLGGPAQ
jgi:hypothetical protein